MASNRFLLLLIGVFSCHHLPEVQARPTDFWCNPQQREITVNWTIDRLKEDMANCVGSETLPSPVQLPFVGIQAAKWARKTLQQKRADVFAAFQLLQDVVQLAINQTTLRCQRILLRKLDLRIKNYLLIIKRVQVVTVTPSESIRQDSTSQTSLRAMLQRFEELLTGKLERLAVDHEHSICKAENTMTTGGPD